MELVLAVEGETLSQVSPSRGPEHQEASGGRSRKAPKKRGRAASAATEAFLRPGQRAGRGCLLGAGGGWSNGLPPPRVRGPSVTCEPVQSLPPRPLASFWPLKLTAQLKVPELPDTTRQVPPTEERQTPPSPQHSPAGPVHPGFCAALCRPTTPQGSCCLPGSLVDLELS